MIRPGRYSVPGRYSGSLTQHHGTVLDVTDCSCALCCELTLWDERRRYALVVHPDGSRLTVKLSHVHTDSFDATRQG